MAMSRIVGVFAMAVSLMAAASSISVAAPAVGDPAPALKALELNGKPFELSAEHGKVVIVNFWATWCVPCRQEMPRLDAFYKKYRGEGVDLIGISADQARNRDDVQKIMSSFSYPAAMMSDTTANGFGRPTELPITYIIGPDGVVRDKLIPTDESGISMATLEGAVLGLLHGASTPVPRTNG